MAFPTTPILDTCVRANEGPPPSASWSAASWFDATSDLQIVSNTLQSTAGVFGGLWGTVAGADVECYITVSTLYGVGTGTPFQIRCRQNHVGDGAFNANGYAILFERINANPGLDVKIMRVDVDANFQLGATISDTSGLLDVGDKLGMSCVGSTISAYRNRAALPGWVLLGSRTDATYSNSGYFGVRPTETTSAYVDFGGGTAVVTPTVDLFLHSTGNMGR